MTLIQKKPEKYSMIGHGFPRGCYMNTIKLFEELPAW